MIIILEGPDGGGKTTFATRLMEQGFRRAHTGVPQPGENLLITYATALYDAIRLGNDVVFDRLQLGESIYGPIMRGVDKIGDEGQIILQRIIRGAGVKQVICLPPYSVCVKNWMLRNTENKEYIKDTRKFRDIYEAYEKIRSRSWLARWVLDWDYTRIPVEDAVAILTSSWTSRASLPQDIIGDPGARFLFVGEIANQEYLDLPWVDLGNSSHFLNTCLWDAGYDESEMAFTNVLTLDNRPRDIGYLVAYFGINHPRIIALGKKTGQLLSQQGIKANVVPHPAYWKRFHSRDTKQYVKMLRDIRVSNYAKHG